MQEVYLLLGSNLGEREEYLHKAAQLITERVGKVLQGSAFYQTAAWGITDQPAYINQILLVGTELDASEVLINILRIEKELGRERFQKWEARVIDIDILFYSDLVINEAHLTIPHPHFEERRFAVEPMLELAPDFIHPVLKKTIKSIALELTDNLSVERI